jgi:hypothetical protein
LIGAGVVQERGQHAPAFDRAEHGLHVTAELRDLELDLATLLSQARLIALLVDH